MNIILIGPPGSGKGTQAFQIKEKYNMEHVSTGDLFKSAIKNQTELGKQVSQILDRGGLVDDELTLSVVQEALDKVENGYMLDGFPRTLRQAQMLFEIGENIDAVIYLNVGVDLLIERLTGRRVCRNCGASYHVVNMPPQVKGVCDKCGGELYQRSDDNEEVAKVRLDEFFKNTLPVIDYYKEQGIVYEIDGSLPLEEVTSKIDAIFGELK